MAKEKIVKNRFIPEIPDSLRYEQLDYTKLVVPIDAQIPETTEQMINRILNVKLGGVSADSESFDDSLDFHLDSPEEESEFDDDFFDDDKQILDDVGVMKGLNPEPVSESEGTDANASDTDGKTEPSDQTS